MLFGHAGQGAWGRFAGALVRLSGAAIVLTVGIGLSFGLPIAQLESGIVDVGSTTVTVTLARSYTEPVVVCSVQYDNNLLPVVPRVSGITPTSFDVRLQNPSDSAGVLADQVNYLVVEKGTWTVDGVRIEAQTYASSVTDHDRKWLGELQSYGQTYASPVVLGQVMSESDPDWSVFWNRGAARSQPPSATVIYTGKTVGEDPDVTRNSETIGFIVFEAGHGTLGGVEFEANLGPDTVRGVGDAPPYSYSFATAFTDTPSVIVTNQAAMDGAQGSWSQIHGATAATPTTLFLSVDEDQVGDVERVHTNEQIAYVAFSSPVVYPADPCGNGQPDAGEGCDDGNADNTDACLDSCTAATCGDGFVRAGVEQCDDGGTGAGDGCSALCVVESGWSCTGTQPSGCVDDDECAGEGAGNNCDANATCTNSVGSFSCTCHPGYIGDGTTCVTNCGNGVIDLGEECDDGNPVDDDLCSNACTENICGNSRVDPGEECDDGNAIDDDGCALDCTSNVVLVARFIADPVSGPAPLTVVFDATPSISVGGTIVSLDWDFDDGTGNGSTASHLYNAPGTYTVTLTVSNDLGDIAVDTATISVFAQSTVSLVPFTQTVVDPSPPRDAHVKAVGDIDGDGFDDVIVGSAHEGEGLFWYRYPDWAKHQIWPPGTGFTTNMQTGDVDNDGDLDVIVPHGFSKGDTVWWYENPRPAGDPALDPWNEHFIATAGAHDLEVGDLNNDGKLDVVVRRVVTTLLLQLSPTSWTSVVIGDRGYEGLDLGDLDGDGDLDVAINGYWLDNPTLPAGDAEFDPWIEYLIDAAWPLDLAAHIADVNADGRNDVILGPAESAGNRLSWYEAPPDPRHEAWPEHVIDDSVDYYHTFKTADVNKDGYLDLVTAEAHQSTDPDEVSVYFQDGSGLSWTRQIVATTGSHNLRVTDFGNDGDIDIMGVNWSGGIPVYVWRNEMVVDLGGWRRHLIDPATPWQSVFINGVDIDGDGLKDIVAGGWWYRNPGTPSGPWTRNDIGAPLGSMAWVQDFDNDGDQDILGTDGQHNGGGFYWASNDGAGSFTIDDTGTASGYDFLQGIAAGDFVTPESTQIALSWHRIASDLQVLELPAGDLTTNDWSLSTLTGIPSQQEGLSAGDIDDDGDLDLFQGSRWLRNDFGTWTQFVASSVLDTELPDRNRLTDVDGDGDLDAVVGLAGVSKNLHWLEAPDDPTQLWTLHTIATKVGGGYSLDVADLDNDGDADVVLGEHKSATRLIAYENSNAGAAWIPHVVDPGGAGIDHHDGARVADMDGDGDLDILSIGWVNDKVWLFENEGVGCLADAECDDGVFCNGTEICGFSGCQPAEAPCALFQTCDEATDSCVGPDAQLETATVSVGSTPVTVPLAQTYHTPVVVCSVHFPDQAPSPPPVVTRISNAGPGSFDLRLQNPSGVGIVNHDVTCLIVEAGAWTIDGVPIEAWTQVSTVTDHATSWVGESQGYYQSYAAPVVLGQVMSENDPAWSAFWSRGASVGSPPDNAVLFTGKHVGEDNNTTRSNETIGVIVVESGHGTLGGVEFESGLGADSVGGVDNSPPYAYSFSTPFPSTPNTVVVTQSAMDGAHGSWAQTYGSPPATATSLFLSVDEDQVLDAERVHTNEQVAYVAFAGPVLFPVSTPCVSETECSDGVFCNGTEQCVSGTCQAGIFVSCDDGVGCTVDICNEVTSGCDHTPDDSACSNGTFCDGTETCSGTLDCQPGTPESCDDGVDCTVDGCDGTTDSCENTPDDSSCDNGLYCDGAETCNVSSGCEAGALVSCDDSVGCTVDSCDETLDECAYAPNDGLCDDDLFCDGSETCDVANDCQVPENPCPGQTCDETLDACVPCVTDGGCSDGIFCNGVETCVGGVCQAGVPDVCDDGIPCTVDSCDGPGDACVGTPDHGACDNGLFCDGAESCDLSLGCQGGVPVTCNDSVGCTTDTCNETTDSCDHLPVDADCADNVVFCDGVEFCDPALDCSSSGNPCFSADVCDEGGAACVECVTDEDCDDEVFCNGAEACAGNTCQAGTDPCPGLACDELAGSCVSEPVAKLETGTVRVGGDPVTVTLAQHYINPVVVCTVHYENNTVPVVTRVANVTPGAPTHFDVRLQQATDAAGSPPATQIETVSYLVVEEGAWIIDGVAIEAQTLTSNVTDHEASWVGEALAYSQDYTSPVVLGQVMSSDDARWSTFWSNGGSRGAPPSASDLYAGKHVGEDPDVNRSSETLGIIVIEAGHGSIAGVEYEAWLGADTVLGVGNLPPYSYAFQVPFVSPPQVAVLSQAAMDGVQGGWAQTHGATPTTPTSLLLSIDEDQLGDAERAHTTEQVGYVVFEFPVAYPGTTCGNGVIDPGEACDDANNVGGDGCSADCRSDEICGNGIVDLGEDCDDGNTVGNDGCSAMCSSEGPTPRFETGRVTSVGGTPTTVSLLQSYLNPVIVCAVHFPGDPSPPAPVVARVSNVTAISFDVRLQAAANGSPGSYDVSYLVVEEGNWTIDGVNLEAQRYLSTVTDHDLSWAGESQDYLGSYTAPVVLGQVMTENDPGWSVFWSRGGTRGAPPTSSALWTGKHVGEDADIIREDEMVGFIVLEAGHGTIAGVEYETAVGGDSVLGVGDAPPYTYNFATAFATVPMVVVPVQTAMDGVQGSWAQTHGAPATTAALFLSLDEDTLGDPDRSHTSEQVAYVAFASPVVYPAAASP